MMARHHSWRHGAPVLALLALVAAGVSVVRAQNTTTACALKGRAGDQYARSWQVRSLYNGEDMPLEDGGDWESYVRSCATDPVIILSVGLVVFLFLCCINCANCRRLEHHRKHHCCVAPRCFAQGGWRVCAWTSLAITTIVFIALAVFSMRAEKTETDSIRNLPGQIGEFATYLNTTLVDSVECVATQVEHVKNNATDYKESGLSSPAEEALLDQMIAESNDMIDELVSDTLDSLRQTVSDGAREMYNTESELRKATGKAAKYNSAIVVSILVAVTVFLGTSVLLSVSHGLAESCNKWYCSTQFIALIIVFFMLLVWIIAAVFDFVLIFTAGLCYNPYLVLDSALGTTTSDMRIRYYIRCSLYTDDDERALWPWQDMQQSTSDSFETLTTDMQALKTLNPGTYYDNLEASIINLDTTFTADDGVLGYQGFVGCDMVERYVEGLLVDVCDDWFNSTSTLFVCVLMMAALICVADITQKCLRRERPEDEDTDFDGRAVGGEVGDDDGYHKFSPPVRVPHDTSFNPTYPAGSIQEVYPEEPGSRGLPSMRSREPRPYELPPSYDDVATDGRSPRLSVISTGSDV